MPQLSATLCIGAIVMLIAAVSAKGPKPNFPTSEGGDDIAAFNKWFWSLSATNRRVTILPSQYGNGVFVTNATTFPASEGLPYAKELARGIKSKDPIIEVPVSRCICDESIQERKYGPILHPSQSGISEENRLALSIAVEKLLGSHSKVRRWMKVVPTREELVPPYRWTDAQKAFIEPASSRHHATSRARQIKEEFAQLRQHPKKPLLKLQEFIGDTHSNAGTTDEVPSHDITFELFTWAKSLIDTRAWNMDGRKYFVPGADMFNHHADDGEDQTFDYRKVPFLGYRSSKFVKHHKVTHRLGSQVTPPEITAVLPEATREANKNKKTTVKVLQVYSDRTAAPGEQLYESYGDNSNAIYFDYHGFVPEEGNRHDCQDIDLNPPSLTSDQRKLLEGLVRAPRKACIHKGEVPAMGLVASLVSSLPPAVASSECAQRATHVNVQREPYRTLMHVHERLVGCLNATLDGHSAFDVRVDGMKALKAIVMKGFKGEFASSNVEADTKVLKEWSEKSESGADAEAWRVVAALKFRIGRKRIYNGLMKTLTKRIATLRDARDALKKSESDEL